LLKSANIPCVTWRYYGTAADSSHELLEKATLMRLVVAARIGFLVALAVDFFPSALIAAPIKLNGSLTLDGDVDPTFRFSPDSSRILYVADQDTPSVFELYSVPSAGGASLKLSGSLVNGGDVVAASTRFSPDGSRVAYVADKDSDEVLELYSVASSGGTILKLSAPLPVSGSVDANSPVFSPNSSRIIYRADQQTDQVFELYTVPATGGATTKLNGTLVNGGDVGGGGLLYSPDGSHVLYVADQDTDEASELYSVLATGGTPQKLNGPLVMGGNVASASAKYNANGSRVIYVADQDHNSVDELYSVATTGGAPVKLNGPLVSGGDVSQTSSRFSPDGNRVVYRADQNTDEKFELYSVPSTGGTPVKLNGSLVSAGDVVADSARISPDSTHVLYLADQDTDNKFELYNVPIAGGTPLKLNGLLPTTGDVTSAEFTPDGSRVIYLANEDAANMFELYSVPSSGGIPTKLSGPLVTGGDVTDFAISPNGQRVVYRADTDTDEVYELYSIQTTTSIAPLAGDYNGNGIVDIADYTIWRDTLGSTIDLRANGDNNGASTGKIDQADYTFWRSHFGTHAGSGASAGAAIPEPSTLWLGSFCSLGLIAKFLCPIGTRKPLAGSILSSCYWLDPAAVSTLSGKSDPVLWRAYQ
jgi:Tol biopolymer transport system component